MDKLPWRGPLHGLAIGLKDIFDTANMPTQPGFGRGHHPLDGIWEVVARCEGRAALLNLAWLHPALPHKAFLDWVSNIAGFTRHQLVRAYDTAVCCRMLFDEIAREYDGLATPSAPWESPLERTQGGNLLNRDWTLLHVPCINIPVA